MHQKASATSSSYVLLHDGPEFDFFGRKMNVPMRMYGIKWSAHVNKSGSPVFASIDNGADKGLALAGIVAVVDDAKGEAGFISLEAAIPYIRSSLVRGSACRLSDFCTRFNH